MKNWERMFRGRMFAIVPQCEIDSQILEKR
jgi:hypothetical protein